MALVEIDILRDTLIDMATEQIYNPQILIECAQNKKSRLIAKKGCSDVDLCDENHLSKRFDMKVEKSDINLYNKYMV